MVESASSHRLQLGPGLGIIRFRAGAPVLVMIFLAVWLCGWAVGEVTVISQLLRVAPQENGSAFLIFWLLGWTLGGGIAAGFLLWSLFGNEIIEATPVGLIHSFRLFGFQHTRRFASADISNFGWSEGVMRRQLSALTFDYGTRTIRVLYGIDNAEAKATIKATRTGLGAKQQ